MRNWINIIIEARDYEVINAPDPVFWWANQGQYCLRDGSIVDIKVSKRAKLLEVKAYIGDKIVGFVDFAITEIEGAYRPQDDDYDDDIISVIAEHLHVDEAYRRLGIATLMYDHVERTNVTIHRSSDQWVDGRKFWATRSPLKK